jgi:rod shape-determining protein MreD
MHVRPHGRLFILLTFGAAMLLRILPLPEELARHNPDWLLLVLIYWLLAVPEAVGVGVAWCAGLLADVLTGKMLGQQAFAYSLVAWACLKLYRRLRLHPLTQQTLAVLGYLFLAHGIDYWILNVKGLGGFGWSYWLSVPLGALLWPLVYLSLRHIRRVFHVR